MKTIDESVVRHMAQLSKLTLTDEEIATYTDQLARILDYASHLPELTPQEVRKDSLRLDEDEVRPCEYPHELLRNAVAVQDGYVRVPSILDKGEGSGA